MEQLDNETAEEVETLDPMTALEGEVLTAKVREVGEGAALLDLDRPDLEAPCRLPWAELEPGEAPPEPGDEVDVFLERSAEDRETLVASPQKAACLRLWDTLVSALDDGEELEGVVVAKVKGGLAVDVGVRAFLPASQASLRPGGDTDDLVGQRRSFTVIEFNRKRGNVVVSLRKQLEAEQAELKAQTLARIKEGEVLTGRVRSFTDYGAFVDLGGIDGLVHLTDLSWGRIKRPSEAVKIGQEIRVKVLKYEPDRERISLGYKQLQEDPWAGAADKYPVGARVKGPVVSLMDYGVFVQLEPGIDGLVHATEMSWVRRVKHPKELVKVGQQVEAQVLDVDLAQRRIALGMKQLEENPWEKFAQDHPVGSTVSGVVRRIKDFGMFVETPEGLDGLIRTGDLAWNQRGNAADLYKTGDEVQAQVLEVEPAKERLALGIKQLTEDPWKSLADRYPAGSQVTGKVTKAVEFGLFIELEEGIEGLCHISQLSTERVDKPTDVANVGDELKVAVLEIDARKRRISLSVRALSEDSGDYQKYLREQAEEEKRFGNTLGVALAEKLAADEAKREEAARASQEGPGETAGEDGEDESSSGDGAPGVEED